MFSTSQKNTLLKTIQDESMDARAFTLTASTEPLELRLTYKPEKFYLRVNYTKIGKDQNGVDLMRLSTFSIPKPGLIFDTENEYWHNNIDKWETVLAIVGQWLKLLKSEFTQADLWAELERTPDVFIEDGALPEDSFTPAEIKLLEARVAEVEQQIIDLNLPPDAEAAITQAIREIPEKAKRLSKKEMGDILLSSLMKEGLKWALTKEHILTAWHICLHLFTLALPN